MKIPGILKPFCTFSGQTIDGPDDVGGVCPKPSYAKELDDGTEYCCCSENCCWNNCTATNITEYESCLQDVSGTEWVFNPTFEYFQVERLLCKL